MDFKKLLPLSGYILIGLSLLLLGLSFLPGWSERTGPAVIFLSVTVFFVFLQFAAPADWWWKGFLFIPTTTFFAFGVVFLFNAITNDWGSWAYAWMLCISGAGLGVSLAMRTGGIKKMLLTSGRLIYNVGLWTASGFAVLFSIFGAIANGPFMRVFSLILLAVVGILMIIWFQKKNTWLDWETLSPEKTPVAVQAALNATNQALVEPLSKRELEVLQGIDQGFSNAEIARRLVVAHSTVKTHINNIYTKLGVQSRTQAVRKAKDLGLL